MSDTTAKIRPKGLEHTGVTDEHADAMYRNVGGHYVGVVDLQVAKHAVDADGNRSVELIINGIEVAPLDDRAGTAEHIRRLQRALHYERGLHANGPQLPLEESDEPTVEQVRAAGAHLEYQPAEGTDDGPNDSADGSTDEPDSVVDSGAADEENGQDDNPAAWEPHTFTTATLDGPCTTCGGPETWGIHNTTDLPPTTDDPANTQQPNPFTPVPA